jgi:sugar transferase (PEP-CTERM/EpsH1 system associated)
MQTTTSTMARVLSTPEKISAYGASRSSRLRILHVVNRLDLGGTESGILKVITGLGDSDFSHALCTARGHNPAYATQYDLTGRLFDASEAGSNRRILVGCFARIMRSFRPHIVHSRNWGAIEAVFAARIARVPVIVHSEHGYELDILQGLPLRRRLLRRAAYALCDAVFTVSEDLRGYHAEQAWFSPRRMCVLANGVDSNRFAPSHGKRETWRSNLGLSPNTLLVGSVGRLVPIKGHGTLLDAAEVLARSGVEVALVLVGDGPELERLRVKTANSPYLANRVHFLGASKDIAAILSALDVFVLPSVSEGMSNTLLEAMSAGLPVVATKVGGNTELVTDQVSGLLFRVGDTPQLVAHLERLARAPELRSRLGASARSAILADYRLDSMLERYRNLYKELAARRGISFLRTA